MPDFEPKIALFIPTFNVRGTVISVLESIPIRATERFQCVLIVDNGSTDGTVEELTKWIRMKDDRKFRLFSNRENYMLGGSTVVALRLADDLGADYLVCMHSDGQADPADLARFIELSDGRNDFVFGSRLSSESRAADYSPIRITANRIFSWLQKRIIGVGATDIGAFISFRLETVKRLPFDRIPTDMGYHPLLVMMAFRRLPQMTFAEFPISWGKVGTSHVNVWLYGLKHLYRIAWLAAGRLPIGRGPAPVFPSEEVQVIAQSDARR